MGRGVKCTPCPYVSCLFQPKCLTTPHQKRRLNSASNDFMVLFATSGGGVASKKCIARHLLGRRSSRSAHGYTCLVLPPQLGVDFSGPAGRLDRFLIRRTWLYCFGGGRYKQKSGVRSCPRPRLFNSLHSDLVTHSVAFEAGSRQILIFHIHATRREYNEPAWPVQPGYVGVWVASPGSGVASVRSRMRSNPRMTQQ